MCLLPPLLQLSCPHLQLQAEDEAGDPRASQLKPNPVKGRENRLFFLVQRPYTRLSMLLLFDPIHPEVLHFLLGANCPLLCRIHEYRYREDTTFRPLRLVILRL